MKNKVYKIIYTNKIYINQISKIMLKDLSKPDKRFSKEVIDKYRMHAQENNLIKEFENPNLISFLAVENNKVLDFIVGYKKDDNVCYIDYMSGNNLEIKRDLIRRFIEECKERNITKIIADAYDLKLDFLSWHHYGTDVDSFANDMHQVNTWLSGPEYAAYRSLPRIISEWGFDSNPNPISETNIAAAHTVSAIRYLVEEDLEMAFAFEIRDGINPSWGILSYTGDPKPRYYGLRLLNVLGRTRVKLEGEGTYVKALASRIQKGVSAVVVNYDIENAHTEVVPFTINGLQPGLYSLNREWLNGEKGTVNVRIDESGQYSELLYMEPNSVVAIELRQI